MKPRGRRRKFVQVIPERKCFVYDRGSDLYLPVDAAGIIIPRLKMSHAQWEAIGEELAGLKLASENPTDPELVEKINAFLLKPRPGLGMVKALMQARAAYLILVENGYRQYRCDRDLDWIATWNCWKLARQLSDRSIDEAEASPPAGPADR